MRDALDEAVRLADAFESLNTAVPQISNLNRDDGLRFENTLEAAKAKLASLQKRLGEMGVPNDGVVDFKGKAKETYRKLSYPFRQDTVKSMRQTVRSVTEDVQLSLDIHGL